MESIPQRKTERIPLALIGIVGPTASGKSALGVVLAKHFRGEIVSADSRQVYKGLDIGAGKITQEEIGGIPHHLLDVASPRGTYTASRYQKAALGAISTIHKRNHIPFLVGGSPFYVYSVIDGISFPEVPPNLALRKELALASSEELYSLIQEQDPARAATIQKTNKRRLIRALEIIHETGKPVPALMRHPLPYPVLLLGLTRSKEELAERIRKRIRSRMRDGMIQEVQTLRDQGLSWKRLESFGLEYRCISLYLQGKLLKTELEETLFSQIKDFARRQMTWFSKDKRIHWVETNKQAEIFVKDFLATLPSGK